MLVKGLYFSMHVACCYEGIFHLINGGKPVTRDSMVSILRQTYYEDSADDVDKFADILFRQIDKQRRGVIAFVIKLNLDWESIYFQPFQCDFVFLFRIHRRGNVYSLGSIATRGSL
jgi:hypothetical protein